MKRFKNFVEAEGHIFHNILRYPDYDTTDTLEILGLQFSLDDPTDNQNLRSNYEYAHHFFEWIMSGNSNLSDKVLELNPVANRFLDTTGLPENFNTSYGQKIKRQLPVIKLELTKKNSRRAYLSILREDENILLNIDSPHEYPCTVGVHFINRYGELHVVTQMRSNNCFSVLPYDVYIFTSLQIYLAKELGLRVGTYTHQITCAHIFKKDINKITNTN